jgi:sialate O-acetylesterase
MARTYGRSKVVVSGPLYRTFEVEGSRIRLHFDFAEGLTAKGPLKHFHIAAKDRKFVRAQAKIEAEAIVVWSDKIEKPVAVRYAWIDDDEPTLANAAGLPMACFRTDNWPAVGLGDDE